jgi:hypothetical protein
MTTDVNESGALNLVVREPAPTEVGRAIYLFQHLVPPPGSRLIIGVRTQPIERLVAASAGWLKGNIARFRVACLPGVKRAAVSGPLVAKMEEWARNQGAETLEYADLLADENELCAILGALGFSCTRSERYFEVSTRRAYDRVMALAGKYRADIPAGWRTESIRTHSPETVVNLVAQHALLPLSELRHYWQTDSPFGFEMDMSSTLFDGRLPFGTLLLRRSSEAFVIDVRVVTCENPRLRALGNLCLFLHVCQHGDPDGSVRWLQFRGGETEHRETANLAIRMGGQELPPRRVFGKRLR